MATNIKDKIAKLLALAESPNENEAKAALLKARELMAEHKLRPEEVVKADKVKVIREVLDVTCTAMTNPLGRLPVRYHRGALLLPSLPKPGRWLQDEQDWPGGAGRGLRDCEADFPLRL